ncbi:MAG: tetratricopeptide repeat protein [Bacteroidia bacterium]
MLKKFYILICFIVPGLFCSAQNNDSLLAVYNNKNLPDTIRIKAIDDIAWGYASVKPDSSILLANEEIKFANRLSRESAGRWYAKAFSTKGASYLNTGNYPKALDSYLSGLKINEESNNEAGVASSYVNIGLIYKEQLNYSKALEYSFKSLKLYEKLKNDQGIAYCYNNIGVVYEEQKDLEMALEYYIMALKIFEKLNNKKEIANGYIFIGVVYSAQLKDSQAREYYIKALQLKREIGDLQGVGICYLNLSSLYDKSKNYKLAIQYSDSTIEIAKGMGDINSERIAYQNLALFYSKTGNYKEAYEDHVKFKLLTDSIFNADNSKQLGDLKTQFEVEKKEAELKAKSDAEESVNAVEKKRQQLIIYSVAGVLLIVIIFSVLLYKRFRLANKQKQIIEEQKVLVDKAYDELQEKNKEVMDSIYYARRIQSSLLTSEKYIKNNLTRLMKK